MSETAGEHVATRLRDPELVESLEAAEEDHGSKSEAMRHALRETYGDDASDTDSDDELAALDLSPTAKQGYETMRETAGVGHMFEVDAAKSLIARDTQIPSESVKAAVFGPLRRAGLLGVSQRPKSVFVTVRPVTAAVDGDDRDA